MSTFEQPCSPLCTVITPLTIPEQGIGTSESLFLNQSKYTCSVTGCSLFLSYHLATSHHYIFERCKSYVVHRFDLLSFSETHGENLTGQCEHSAPTR